MKIYRTSKGIVLEHDFQLHLLASNWDDFINDDSLYRKCLQYINHGNTKRIKDFENATVLAPIVSQELWAAGVTYFKSKKARMEESKDQGGGSFYDKVYNAERPELFFKANGFRVKGSNEKIRIRKDSKWNVPEPELTLLISSNQKILGYTIGNDVSSRSIEGENPLYLGQAKSYNGSAALGPCIWVPDQPNIDTINISMSILRNDKCIYEGQTTTDQMKRSAEELVHYLFKELDFPNACFLMTGTGIIPPDNFTLRSGDRVEIKIDHIGTLVNMVD